MEFRHRFSACEQTEPRPANRSRKGFTLVELLVVIAIIGVLVALLLPAIQAAREAARRAQCKNNVKQIGLATLNFESAANHLPTGGWGFKWMGDPDRGFGKNQTGGWCYNILPFLEQTQVRLLGKGAAPAVKRVELGKQMATVIPGFYCPSRRVAQGYQAKKADGTSPDAVDSAGNLANVAAEGVPNTVGKTDYAFNGGHQALVTIGTSQMDPGCDTTFSTACATKAQDIDNAIAASSGVIALRSEFTIQQMVDGTSNTILAGEKFLRPMYYESGIGLQPDGGGDGGDNSACYQGTDWDNTRYPAPDRLPTQDVDFDSLNDTPTDQRCFGSAHSAGINVVMVDGSVQGVSYDVDPKVWNLMGGRDDGE